MTNTQEFCRPAQGQKEIAAVWEFEKCFGGSLETKGFPNISICGTALELVGAKQNADVKSE